MNLDDLKAKVEQEFPKVPFRVEQVGEITKVVLTKRLEPRDFAQFAGYIEQEFGGNWVSLGDKSHFKIVNIQSKPVVKGDNGVFSELRYYLEKALERVEQLEKSSG